MTAHENRRPATVVKILILLSTVNIVKSTYLISVSDDKMTNQSESVILSCKAYNNLTAQEFTVAWRRSGVVITERKLVKKENLKQFINEDELYRYTIQGLPVSPDVTDFRLEIKDLKKEDIGDYACSLCKRYSSSFSCIEPLQIEENLPVSLDVMYTPIDQYPKCSILTQTSLGSEITVECVTEKGKPHVDLKLTIDGDILHKVSTTELPSEEDDGLLKITHSLTVTESIIGKMIGCNSTSPYFKDYTGRCANGIITVDDVPDISLTSTPAESVFIVGERVSFTCTAKSRSQIMYFDWITDPKSTKNRMTISTELLLSTSTVTLDEAIPGDDNTRIKCVVANKAGEIQNASIVLSINEELIPSTAKLEIIRASPEHLTTVVLRNNADGSNTVLIVGIILAFIILIVISGIAGYLLFVRRKMHKGHKPVPLNETSTIIMPDNTCNESSTSDEELPDKCKTETASNGFADCKQDKDVKLPEGTPEVQEYRDLDDSNNLDDDDDDDDVFMNVTQTLPIPTHV